MPREQLFVVSKVAAEHKTNESAAKSIDETLEKMGLDYLVMMIIHSRQPLFTTKKGRFTTSLFIVKKDMPKESVKRNHVVQIFKETDFRI